MNHLISPSRTPRDGSDAAELLYALSDQLAGSLGGSVAVEDLGRRILAHSTLPGLAIDEVRSEGILRREVPPAPGDDELYDRVLASETPCWVPSDGREAPRVAAAIRTNGVAIGSVWAILPGEDAPSEAALAQVADTAAAAAAPVLARLESVAARHRPEDRRFVEALGDARARLGHLRPLPATGSRMLLYRVHEGAAHAVRERARRGIGGVLDAFQPGTRTALTDAGVLALVPGTGSSAEANPTGAEQAARLLAERPLPLLDRVLSAPSRVAVSRPLSPERRLWEVADRLGNTLDLDTGPAAQRIVSERELRHRLFLARIAELTEAEPELGDPAMRELTSTAAGRELALVLRTWLDTGRNVARTAVALGLHENTVRGRVERARERLGLDLEDPEAVLSAWVQLRMDRAQG